MRDKILEGIKQHIQPIYGLEKAVLLETEPGHAKISVEIEPEALNIYGNLHGGFIFSLCDIVCGMAGYAYECENVTQQGSINFLKGVNSGKIYAEANAVHKGKRTLVCRADVTNEDGVLLATGNFTMYFLNPVL